MLALAVAVQAIVAGQRPAATKAAPQLETRPAVSKDSVRFLVVGDSGTGDSAQRDVAAQMWKSHAVFPYEFAIMVGDNLYGSERPQDYSKKFEIPFKPILDANIPFYASLGNHDDPNQRFYKPFNMGGQRFYSFRKKDVQFFALDSNYMDKDQQRWLEEELSKSNAKWKIPFFHHPIYSSGGRHGSEVDLRAIVEPLFLKYGVSVVIAGHEHFYERLKPQKGIYYFTAGGSAKLRSGDIVVGALTAKGFDSDRSFLLVEIEGDLMHFQAISRAGRVVDSGTITRPRAGGTS
jgi:hypothetical protein